VTQPLTIVGLGGSLARASRSLAALRVALDGAAEAGASTKLLNLRELDLPIYKPDDEREPPPAASTLIEACFATRFANHVTPQRARECEESAERVAAAAVSTTIRP
jgi:NAD(P)H-dependent FMN reductase